MRSDLGFATNLLDRSGAERDPDIVARQAATADSVLIGGEFAVLAANAEARTALIPPEQLDGATVLERVYLGRSEGRDVIGALLDGDSLERFRAEPGFLVMDLRAIAVEASVAAPELGLLAQAKSLLNWHRRHRFCAQCGTETASACAGLRRDCPFCNAQHFPRTDPVAIMLITRGDSCLLGRQTRFVAGSYSCLAGFISPGETIEDAVRREVLEEAGIRVGRVRYLLSQPWPFPSSLMIGCLGEAETGTIAIDRDELEDCRWFERREVGAMLARTHPDGLITPPPMAIAHHLMRSWVEGESGGWLLKQPD